MQVSAISTAVCILSLLLSECRGVGRSHSPDARLQQNFYQHEAEFQILLADVQADPKLTTVMPGSVFYAGRWVRVTQSDYAEAESLGLSRGRWNLYQQRLRTLGLEGGVFKTKDHVAFRVEPGLLSNGDSDKGYKYTLNVPEHLKDSLDEYRVVDADKLHTGDWIVHRALKGNWYLYLYVNR